MVVMVIELSVARFLPSQRRRRLRRLPFLRLLARALALICPCADISSARPVRLRRSFVAPLSVRTFAPT